ncbi:Cell division protein DamX [Pseudoalteromonas sp. CIP111854]|uniref:Cell division protein DamX n=1 Tax=Pseudoalteromonas holothuriae TaxID=2963714 RepID=A0A9W4QVW1_9GAMM|nr:SPOR domain-containing protein [Pseudoalteromonas sp. CIP111854]CAH9055081.1 Cell division protein DamX [Pseudoalteromonas sp. CIP111854]
MQSKILPSRAALVDRIALQFEYGQSLICLVGSSGLGKSYIAESFITDKYSEFNKAFIQLSATTKDSELMMQLLQHSFRAPLVDHNQSLSQNFYALYQKNPPGPCLWVLDGSRHLSDEMITQLQILAKKSPETLYILVTAQSPNMLPQALDIHLERLSIDESRRLMAMFFKQLPSQEDPIFNAFLSGCEGNPAVLLQWQTEQQVDLRAGTKQVSKLSWHLVLLTVILAILMVALIYQKELTALLPASEQSEELNTVLPVSKALDNEPEQQADTLKTEQVIAKDHVVQPSNQDNNEQVNRVSNNSSAQNIAAIVSALANEKPITESMRASYDQIESQKAATNLKVIPKQQAGEPSRIELLDTDVEPKKTTKDIIEKPLINSRQALKQNDSEWLLTRNNNEWAIQLLAVKDEAVAQEFVDLYQLTNVKVYKATRINNSWWIVILGPFESLEQAQLAKSSLPEQILSGQPFFKKVDKIKQEIDLPTR